MSSTSVESLQSTTARPLRRLLYGASGLVLFLLALELVKKGAAGLTPLLQPLQAAGDAGALGFGWLMACVVLSGSPVAAVALGLLAGGTLAPRACLAMIVGSRLGASFSASLSRLVGTRRRSTGVALSWHPRQSQVNRLRGLARHGDDASS